MRPRFAVLLAAGRGKWTSTVTAGAGNVSRDAWRNVTGRSAHAGRSEDRWVPDRVSSGTHDQSGATVRDPRRELAAGSSSTSSSANSVVGSSNRAVSASASTSNRQTDATRKVGATTEPSHRDFSAPRRSAPSLPVTPAAVPVETTGVLVAGMTTFRREMWSRAAAAASEEERQEEELQGGERQGEVRQGEGMRGEGRPGEGLAVRDGDRRDAETDGSGREAERRGEGRREASERTGGMQGVVVNRGRGSIVIPAERWQYVQQQLAIIRSQIPPPAFKSGPAQQQSAWRKATPSAPSLGEDAVNLDKGGEEQRTDEWYALRANRLTASAFEKAVGFFPGGRQQLWEEKLGLRAPFAGNDATAWGQGKEEEALMEYERLTGGHVEHRSFQVYRDADPTFSWLGASPDGLLPSDPLSLHSSPHSPGVLEIKCPWNRGLPLSAAPYPSVPHYYMPQIQGLLEIFDRDWLDFFVWTKMGGSALFRVERDKKYWELLFTALEEFWWVHLVPAKEALTQGQKEEDVRGRFYPGQAHVLMREIKTRSEQISKGCRVVLRSDAVK
ncbi:unnamed protein product [Closterium sp. NIES-64]|nr:unnamed protein product [Closterium sp. NIES-64]